MSVKRKRRSEQQIYGRNDMVNIEPNKKIYGSLGKTEKWFLNTVEGNPVTMENSREGSFEKELTEFDLYGRSKQETTTGANLAKLQLESGLINGINITRYDDGSYNFKGTCTSDIYKTICSFNVEIGETYYFSGGAKNGTNTTFQTYILSKKEVLYYVIEKGSFTAKEKEYYLNCDIYKGNTVDFTIKPMLNLGSEALPFEPYTGGKPSPSPEYPQEIVSAGMKWSTGKNLFDERLLDDESNYNKQYQSSGYWILAIPVKNGLVTVSVKNTTNWGGYLCVNSTGIVGDVGGVWMAHGSVSNLKRTATLTITHGFVYLLMSKGVDTNKRTLKEVGYIQVEYGSEATDYEPYTGGIPKPYGDKVGVSVRGKNLFHITKESDCDKAYDNTTKRIILPGEYIIGLSANNYHIENNASIDLNTDSISFIYSGNSGYGVGIGINCQKNKTYAFSFETNKGIAYAVFYSEDGKYKARVLISKYNVFVIPDYATYVVIVLTNNNVAVAGDTIWFTNVQIEEAKSITAYEPYRTPQSTAIVTPNGLPGIPVPSNTAGITYTDADGQAWIADEIDFSRGKYIQRVGKVDLENLPWRLIGNCFRSGAISDSKVYKWTSEIANIICSHYICKMTSYNMQYNSDGYDNLIGMYSNQIEIKDTRYNNDVDLFKQSLSGVYAYYVLAILVERDITSAELAEYTQLYSYKPTTVVENDSDVHMKLTYKATGN